jgi:hypothetical protein
MRHYNPLNRFGRLVVLGAVVAGVTASAAVAIPVVDPQDTGTTNLSAPASRPPDIQDAMTARHAAAAKLNSGSTALHTTPAGLKADGLRWQGIAQVYQQKQAVPDVVERYAATHSGGGRLVVPESLAPRPPDVSDAALAARYGSTATNQSSGFDWNDWAIGIGTGIGLALLLGAAFLMGRQLRHPVQTA